MYPDIPQSEHLFRLNNFYESDYSEREKMNASTKESSRATGSNLVSRFHFSKMQYIISPFRTIFQKYFSRELPNKC